MTPGNSAYNLTTGTDPDPQDHLRAPEWWPNPRKGR